MRNPFLVGKKVYLRSLESEDAETFLPWVNDYEVMRTMGSFNPYSLVTEKKWIEDSYQKKDQISLGIVNKDNDRLIGGTGLHRIEHRVRQAGFGIFVGDKKEWNKGFGQEATELIVDYAINQLNLNRVWLHVHKDNERGIRAYTKVGFVQEGCLREAHFCDGHYIDVLVMSVLRDDWNV